MNQQQNAASLIGILAVSLVGISQVWNIVKHLPSLKIPSLIGLLAVYSKKQGVSSTQIFP
jgi:hypothetical protein